MIGPYSVVVEYLERLATGQRVDMQVVVGGATAVAFKNAAIALTELNVDKPKIVDTLGVVDYE